MKHRAAHALVEPSIGGEGKASFELLPTGDIAVQEPGRANAVQSMDDHLCLAERFTKLKRPHAPRNGGSDILCIHTPLRQPAVRHRQLATRLDTLQHRHRLSSGVSRLGNPAWTPQQL